MNKKDIKEHSLRSIKWVGLGNLIPKLFTPIITIWLASILDPSDFGLLALSTVFIGFSDLIQGFGLKDYIIKEKDIDESVLNTAFWINLILGIFLYLILFITSNLIARIYTEPILGKIIRLISIVIIFDSFGTVHLALLRKEMKFKRLFYVRFIPLVVSISCTVPLAYVGFGVWALVLGHLLKGLFTNLFYWVNSDWKPKTNFSKHAFAKLVSFGRWVTLERMGEYLYANLDKLILGYFGSINILGVYSIARQLLTTIFLFTKSPIQNITFPMLSKLQSNSSDVTKAFLKIMNRLVLINLPITIGIAILSFDTIPLLFVNKWEGLKWVVSILVLGEGILINFGAQREIFKIYGRPDIYPKAIILNVFYSIIFYPIGAKFGIIVFCVIRIFNDWLFIAAQMFLVNKFLKLNVIDYYNEIRYAIFSTALMGVIIYILLQFLNLFQLPFTFYFLISIIFLGFLTYSAFIRLFNRLEFKKIIDDIQVIIGFTNLSRRTN